jgi:hypothetical protein
MGGSLALKGRIGLREDRVHDEVLSRNDEGLSLLIQAY